MLLSLWPGTALADAVVLASGQRVEGKVKTKELGKYVVIELPDGTPQTIRWDSLKEVVEDAPGGTVSPAPTGAGSGATGPGTCAEGDEKCREALDLSLRGGARATYEKNEDCARSDDERCKRDTKANLDAGGLGVSVNQTRVTRVTGPKSGATQFLFGANGLVASLPGDTSLSGLGLNAGLRVLSGGEFPGEKGGGWTGFFLEGNAAASVTTLTYKVPTETGSTKEETKRFGSLTLGGTAGLQLMKFGELDPKTLKQEAHGLLVGGQLGRYIPAEGDATTTYGPAIGYVHTDYNPGTGSVNAQGATLFILPTKDFLLFLATVSFAWGS